MSKTNRSWQCAREAMLSAREAEAKKEKDDHFDLARTWTRAALQEQMSDHKPREIRHLNFT
jgi:hypothetical protein